MNKRLIAFLGALLFGTSAWADQLLVNTYYDNRPLEGVDIALDDRPLGSTDALGQLVGALRPGEHMLVCSKNGGELARYRFEVGEGEDARIGIRFTDFVADPEIRFDILPGAADIAPALDFSDVEEVEVLGEYKPQENAQEFERFSVAITDSISIDDLLRAGDSDVASALKRIVGVAVTGGKYANVRGLSGRYISSMLNGGLMPSTDPFRRDVQLDLFPSDILGGIEIQKSFTANLPSDTTGGAILMSTRGLPDEDSAGLSVSLGYVDGVTGERLLGYAGGGSDDVGVDDGTRALPGAVRRILPPGGIGLRSCAGPITSNCASEEQIVAAANSLSRVYKPGRETAAPAYGLSGHLGRRLQRAGGDISYYAAINYEQAHASRQDARFENVQGDADGRTIWDSFHAGLNGYLVAGWQDADRWSVLSKTIVLRETEDRASVESGLDTSNADVLQVDTTFEWVERQFIGQQFELSLPLLGSHMLDASLAWSQTRRDSPDRRSYQYRSGFFIPTVFERSYAELSEDSLNLSLDYQWPFVWGAVYSDLRAGLLLNSRDRDSSLIRLGLQGNCSSGAVDCREDLESLLTPANFASGAFRLTTTTARTDSYQAVTDIAALYLGAETDIGQAWSLVTGLRLEQYALDLDYPHSQQASDSQISDRDSSDLLPALGVTWRPGADWQLRLGYSSTLSRPDTTELARPFFYDAEGRRFLGCPTCSDTRIDNLDLRAEYYFSAQSSLSLALFHKDMSEPLEVTLNDATNGVIRTFENGESASVSGIELDGDMVAFDGIDHVVKLGGNLSWIDSEITLGADAARIEGLKTRPLQGQSPFLANLRVSYDNYPLDGTLTLAVNYFDDRIDSATRGQVPTLYEKGRIDVNLNAEKSFSGGAKLSLKLKNLLDSPIERTQGEGGLVRETYRKGASLSLGYSLSF